MSLRWSAAACRGICGAHVQGREGSSYKRRSISSMEIVRKTIAALASSRRPDCFTSLANDVSLPIFAVDMKPLL